MWKTERKGTMSFIWCWWIKSQKLEKNVVALKLSIRTSKLHWALFSSLKSKNASHSIALEWIDTVSVSWNKSFLLNFVAHWMRQRNKISSFWALNNTFGALNSPALEHRFRILLVNFPFLFSFDKILISIWYEFDSNTTLRIRKEWTDCI